MQQESPPPLNEMMLYFVTQLPAKWNILSHRMKATEVLECEPIFGSAHGCMFQFAVLGRDRNGFVRGFAMNLN